MSLSNDIVYPSRSDPLYNVHFYLNTALMQSPPGISKTQKAVDYIKQLLMMRARDTHKENGVHHMTFVLTNNNLSETKQWKIRLRNRLQGMNVFVLSSRPGEDMRTLDQFWGKLMRIKNASDLPDLTVMCTNGKRTDDLVDLIQTLKNKRYNFESIGIHHISA